MTFPSAHGQPLFPHNASEQGFAQRRLFNPLPAAILYLICDYGRTTLNGVFSFSACCSIYLTFSYNASLLKQTLTGFQDRFFSSS